MNGFTTRGAALPPLRKEVHFVEPIEAKARFKFRCWSPHVWGVWTHYCDKKTSPCYECKEYCHDGHREESARWKGYIFGWHFQLSKAAFIQVTANFVYRLLGQLGTEPNLRGLVLYVGRGPKNNSPLTVQVPAHEQGEPGHLPDDLDPRASLYNLWQIPDLGHKWSLTPLMGLSDFEQPICGKVS